jgi:hypothetical protein
MTNKTTPDDDWLGINGWKYFDDLNGYRKESNFTIPMWSTDQSKSWDSISDGNAKELISAINAKITELLIAAREEQVMQDFLSLNVDFDGCVDESDLIVWRQERIAQLQASQPINVEVESYEIS